MDNIRLLSALACCTRFTVGTYPSSLWVLHQCDCVTGFGISMLKQVTQTSVTRIDCRASLRQRKYSNLEPKHLNRIWPTENISRTRFHWDYMRFPWFALTQKGYPVQQRTVKPAAPHQNLKESSCANEKKIRRKFTTIANSTLAKNYTKITQSSVITYQPMMPLVKNSEILHQNTYFDIQPMPSGIFRIFTSD